MAIIEVSGRKLLTIAFYYNFLLIIIMVTICGILAELKGFVILTQMIVYRTLYFFLSLGLSAFSGTSNSSIPPIDLISIFQPVSFQLDNSGHLFLWLMIVHLGLR